MKTKQRLLLAVVFCSLFTIIDSAFAQGTAFTYQGRLQSNGSPASGNYDFAFALFNSSSTNSGQAGSTLTNLDVGVTNGLFIVTLNFGGVFTGANYWLAIGVRSNGGASFTALNPLQEVTPTPYAVYAEGANALGLSGIIPTSVLPGFQASSSYETVGGGSGNSVDNTYATVGGGFDNSAGYLATVPGGIDNNASGFYSFAAGYNAQATNNGAFVWADGEGTAFSSTTNNQFSVRANGGVRFVTGGAGITLDGNAVLTNNESSVTLSGTFSGNGSGLTSLTAGNLVGALPAISGSNLTSLNAAQLSIGAVPSAALTSVPAASLTGTVADARLSSNVALLNKTQAFTGANTFDSGVTIATGSGAEALNVSGNITGGFATPLSLIQNNSTAANASPALRVVGNGNTPNGVLSVSSQGAGLIAQFGNANSFVAQLDTNGNWTANNYSGSGSGLTSLNASQLSTGVVPTSVLPGFQSGSDYSTVGGGQQNVIALVSDHSVIGGGWNNTIGANDYEGTIAGGYSNTLSPSSPYSTIGGGEYNTNSSSAGTIAGGQNNIAGGQYQSTVGGGYNNQATNSYATVPGGFQNIAGGEYSFAAGQQAQATNQGAFVWADSSNAVFASTTSNQFSVRANGGARFVTGGAGLTVDNVEIYTDTINDNNQLTVNSGGIMSVESDADLELTSGGEMNLLASGSVTMSGAVVEIDGITDLEAAGSMSINGANLFFIDGTIIMGNATLEVGHATCDGTTWQNASDRNAKEDFASIEPREVLEKVSALPITEWKYKVDAEGNKHIGPMAQDFHAAFGLNGTDDKHITTLDEEGVALAAIQGLNQRLNEKDAEIEKLKKQLNDLAATVKLLAERK